MSSFCGVLDRRRLPVSKAFFDNPKYAGTPVSYASGGCNGNVLFNYYPGNGKTTDVFHHNEHSGISVVGTADIYNKDEICDQLNISRSTFLCNDIGLLAAAYRKWGADCAKFINGDFAFAIWDERIQTLTCATDPFNQRPLYYYLGSDQFLFGSRIEHLAGFPFARELNQSWITDFLAQTGNDNEATIYQNIRRIPAAHVLQVGEKGTECRKYWDLSTITPSKANLPDSVAGLQWHMETAVGARVSNASNVGIELSGGLDSNGIAALAAPYLGAGRELTAFTNALPEDRKDHFADFSDEWDAAAQMAKLFGITKHVPVSKSLSGLFEMLNGAIETVGFPSNNFFTMSQESLYKTAASHSVKVLLSGCGGNEGISEFASDRYVYTLLKGGNYFGLMRYLTSQGNISLGCAKTVHLSLNYIRNAEKKRYSKLFQSNFRNIVLKDSLVDQSADRWRACSLVLANQSLKERYFYNLNQYRLFDRLHTGFRYTGKYGMAYRYPLLDVRLLEFYTAIPDKWKASDPGGRAMFRKALAGKLPEQIRTQPKRTDTGSIPFFKLEYGQYYEQLKKWFELLPEHDPVFDFVDRRKITAATFATEWDKVVMFKSLRCAAMVSIFLNNHFKQ